MTIKILQIFLILISANFASAQTESKCFQNDSLQGKRTVNFRTAGNNVSGTFSVEGGDGQSVKTYEFKGTQTGNRLKVEFAGNALPDVAPSTLKDLNWRLEKIGGRQILQIEFYGKNYQTNKYSRYLVDFESCEPDYQMLAKTANSVQFAKGKTSATVKLFFNDLAERKVFSINAHRGQTLEITATGCKISIYLPDKKLYEFVEWENGDEKTFTTSTIDRTTIESLSQTGNYTVIVQKMAEAARPNAITFKITNQK